MGGGDSILSFELGCGSQYWAVFNGRYMGYSRWHIAIICSPACDWSLAPPLQSYVFPSFLTTFCILITAAGLYTYVNLFFSTYVGFDSLLLKGQPHHIIVVQIVEGFFIWKKIWWPRRHFFLFISYFGVDEPRIELGSALQRWQRNDFFSYAVTRNSSVTRVSYAYLRVNTDRNKTAVRRQLRWYVMKKTRIYGDA